MGKNLLSGLRWTAAIALGLLYAGATGQTQMNTKPTLPSAVHVGTAILVTPATPQRQTLRPATQPMTPFERIIAPHMNEFMKQGATGKSRSATPLAQTGVNGSSVNFPGFVGVPFLTVKDGDSAIAYNSVSGDFNHDGHMDVATIKTDGTINVILNPGSFAGIANLTPITSNNNGNPNFLYIAYVIVADMNGDGFPDLVGQDIENTQIAVWLGKGDGTFGPPKTYPVTVASGATWATSAGSSILVGDFNGDGSSDVATLTYSPNSIPNASNTVIAEVTLVNTGTGQLSPLAEEDSTFKDYYDAQFDEATVITSDGSTPSGIAFLMNNQGVNNYSNSGTSVITMASNGDGTFKSALEPASPLVQNPALAVDASVVATNLTGSVSTSSGLPTTDIVFMTGDGAVYDAPYTSGNPTAAHVLVGLNTQLFAFGGAFVPPVTMAPTPPSLISTPLPNQLTMNVADMNGDGLMDLVIYTEAGVTIFPNAGEGVFTAAPTQMAGATPGVQQPQPANYDGSKFNSFLNVDFSLDQVGYFQNLGSAASVQAGQFLAAPLTTGTNTDGNFETFGSNVEVLATADIDGDGLQDLIGLDVSNLRDGLTNIIVGIRNGSGAGNQSSNYTFKTAVKGQDLTNNNGLYFVEPVAISNSIGTSILIVTYAGGPLIATAGKDGVFGTPTTLNMDGKPDCPMNYADVGDVNGDGIPDIVFAYGGDQSCYGQDSTPSGFYTLFGNSDGTFQSGTFTPLGNDLYQVKLVNLSGAAGNLDIAAIDQNFDTYTLAVYVVPNKADGSGSFNIAKASKPVSDYIVSDIVVGDYNSDGKQDLTLLTEGHYDSSTSNIIPYTSGVLLLPGNGDYTFGTPTLVDPGQYPQWGSYADFNGDGNLDLALSELYNIFTEQANTPMVQILPNLGGGIFGDPIVEFSSYLPSQYPFTAYTFAGKFTNSGGTDLLVASNYGTAEFVNRGVIILALSASSTTPNEGAPVTLTATISQAVSAGVAETGSVAFTANGTALGSTPVTGGVATLTTTLPVGSDTITATYSGDSNHNQAGASIALTVTPVSPTFSLSATPATLTLAQGATGTVIVSLAGNSTFSGVVQISCSGAPAEASCVSSPASVTLAAGQSTGLSIVIATTPPNSTYQAKGVRRMPPWTGTVGGLSLAGLAFLLWPRCRRLPRLLMVLAVATLAFGSTAGLIGCTGGDGSKTPNQYAGTALGTYTLTVTATSDALSQTQKIALTVTQLQ